MKRDTVVLIHSLGASENVWQFVKPLLGEQVIVKTPVLRLESSLPEMADTVLRECDGEPAYFAGFSMGGHVLAEILASHPERVRGAIFIGTYWHPLDESAQRYWRTMSRSALEDFDAILKQLILMNLHPNLRSVSEVCEFIEGSMRTVGVEVFCRHCEAMANRMDHRSKLSTYPGRVLVIVGQQDAVVPLPLTEDLVANFPRATKAVIPDAGHLIPVEKPKELAELIESFVVGKTVKRV